MKSTVRLCTVRCAVLVASGNPGCSGFIGAAVPQRFDVQHPVDIVATAYGATLDD